MATLSPESSRRASFTTLPLDVLTHIALDTVCNSPGPPLLCDLATVMSLVSTSRSLNQGLSLKNNPHLYANILRLMCDIEPVERRLGPRAIVASALASELPRRFSMLNRIRECVHSEKGNLTDADLATLFFMMTENDGKNRVHIVDRIGTSGMYRLSTFLQGMEHMDMSTPSLSFVLAAMWMNSEDAIAFETPTMCNETLDLLEPLVLPNRLAGPSAVEVVYFGIQCIFTLPSYIPFAQLCTVERYDALRHKNPGGSEETCVRPSWNWSTRFDEVFLRYLRPHPSSLAPDVSCGYLGNPFESIWIGAWCLPSFLGVNRIFMCYRQMQCQLREYVCTDADYSAIFVDSDEDVDLDRAWFTEGVNFEETIASLIVYEPATARTLYYQPRTSLIESSLIKDTILFGETGALHGATFGNFKFRGRVRQSDGKVALVRSPSNLGEDDLGVWLFHGYVYGGYDLVGQWTNTSSAKDAPAGHGWFRLAKSIPEV